MARMVPREGQLVSELTGLPGGGRSNGLDTAHYKTYITFNSNDDAVVINGVADRSDAINNRYDN